MGNGRSTCARGSTMGCPSNPTFHLAVRTYESSVKGLMGESAINKVKMEEEGETGTHFEDVHLDAGLDLDEITLVLLRDVSRGEVGQGERFEVARLQTNRAFSHRYDSLSIASERERKSSDGDDRR